jgi:hypothetical protein
MANGTGMPRGEAPTVAVRCPRHRWPECWLALSSRKINFATTRATAFDLDRGGGFVDVLVPPAAVGLVGHLVTRLDRGHDPWPGPLPARAGADLWPQLGAVGQLPNPPRDWTGDDPLAAGVLEALEANA